MRRAELTGLVIRAAHAARETRRQVSRSRDNQNGFRVPVTSVCRRPDRSPVIDYRPGRES